MSRLRAALGSLGFFVLAPGTVVGLLPWLVTGWEDAGSGPPAVLGWALLAIGVGFLVHAFTRFVAALGTPAPIAPTQHLVVTGVYRHVRNPMYLAIITAVIGQAFVFASWLLVGYGAVVLTAFVTVVKTYEEPTLRQAYGHEYADYCAAVPGWVPRMRPYRQDGSTSAPPQGRATR